MEKECNWFNRFTNFMDQNIRGVQYGLYFISGTALLISLRKIRPFVKFVKPADIPKHFVAQKQTFLGKVLKIEYSQASRHPVLFVDHYPLFAFPWKKNREGLPIEISGVDVTLNGFSWLQRVLVGKEISFTPLRIDKDRVSSIIYSQRKNIGKQLISTGLATVSVFDLELGNDKFYSNYYKMLLTEEDKAEVKKAGIWYDSEVSLKRSILHKIKSITPIYKNYYN